MIVFKKTLLRERMAFLKRISVLEAEYLQMKEKADRFERDYYSLLKLAKVEMDRLNQK